MPTVSFLFVDQVGSTEQLQGLGDEIAAPVRRALFEVLRTALRDHGGTEVDNTGDGVMAVFDSAVDAVDCAASMMRGVRRHNRTHGPGEQLALRAGVHTGEPVTDEGGRHFGLPVVVAARLCSRAAAGQVLVSDLVRALCASRRHVEFAPVGSVELKGVDEPVAAHEVVIDAASAGDLPLPDGLAATGPFSFVGRDAEVAGIRAAWDAVEQGGRRLLLVAGEPGVGKTRLVAEMAAAVHAEGAVVLFGRCDDELGVPYQPFVEALRHLIRNTATDRLAGRLGRFPGELTRLVPELGDRLDLPPPISSDAETERYRLLESVTSAIAATAATAPVLLVVDDLHWATKPTLLLLRHVLRAADVTGLCVVATYRHTELGRDHPLSELLADLRRESGVERIRLDGLTADEVVAFVTAAAAHDLDERGLALSRTIHAETEGNAFFVGEVLRHLVESGAVFQEDGRWTFRGGVTDLGIPEGVREVVGRRLSRLPAAVNDVLSAAAVAGPLVDVPVLAVALDVEHGDVLAAVDEAVAAGLVTRDDGGRLRFAHALVRTTLYDELPTGRRTKLHRRVGEAIERVHRRHLDDHLPELAHHFGEAALGGDPSRAVAYATRAGDHALELLAHDEAVGWYCQALDLLDAADEPAHSLRADLLADLAEARCRGGDPGYRETVAEAADLARRIGDAGVLAKAALVHSRLGFSSVGTVNEARVALLRDALAAVGDADGEVRARLLASLGGELSFGDRAEADRATAAGLEMARRVGDPGVITFASNNRFITQLDYTAVAERETLVAEQLAIADRLGDPLWRFMAYANAGPCALEVLDGPTFRRYLEETERLAIELGQPVLRWLVDIWKVNASTIHGELVLAERLAMETLQLGHEVGQPDAAPIFGTQLCTIRLHQGRAGELIELTEQVVAAVPDLPTARVLLALVNAESGDPESARAVLEPLARAGFDRMPPDLTRLAALTGSAWVAAVVGEREWAAALEAILRPHLGLGVVAGPLCWGAVDHFVGMLCSALGRFDDADDAFASAAVLHERIESPPLLARTQVEWALALDARAGPGDHERAAALREEASATAARLGLGGVQRRATA